MSEPLKPCPFCGSINLDHDWMMTYTYLLCNDCGAFGPEVAFAAKDTDEIDPEWQGRLKVLATSGWNHRAEGVDGG